MSAPFPQPPSPADLEKALQAFDPTPLFMQSLPSSPAGEGYETYQARSAQEPCARGHGGWCVQRALNFKELGNEYFRGKRWREAVGFYTQGIDACPRISSCARAFCSTARRATWNYKTTAKCSRTPRSSSSPLQQPQTLLPLGKGGGGEQVGRGYDGQVEEVIWCVCAVTNDMGVPPAKSARVTRNTQPNILQAEKVQVKIALQENV
ncbi:hypothetical protein CALVIDRAFT_208284 [Calocera viscosa TUFC12733]|uniref:TPR-like protein n=1 Tax=Calocera viscosa (strain TUFC12733) TaxID=1330018 RepID=A0A167R974_CALVF|nr:hypothetical protein CALVIDRAFT_208284 [Calocera viscosa TUFC12733]